MGKPMRKSVPQRPARLWLRDMSHGRPSYLVLALPLKRRKQAVTDVVTYSVFVSGLPTDEVYTYMSWPLGEAKPLHVDIDDQIDSRLHRYLPRSVPIAGEHNFWRMLSRRKIYRARGRCRASHVRRRPKVCSLTSILSNELEN
jgi:hypothetical protein